MWGATRYCSDFVSFKIISIHAPMWGATRTGDTEHLDDIERILEYDGLADFEE